jgi:Arc/MetJ family transcription regulator
METHSHRTNITLDDDLIRKAQQLTGIKTKKEVIHAALETLIRLGEQAQIRGLRGKLNWQGSLNEQRLGRGNDLD